ncbi:Fusaric acid resistance protein-like-domain-containing protein [Boeremia exigua]|uniref:Fusaric acid resistance protein-like-domain-containing protein n=1 Tax=Boeremia exigua TaxID=749465 RepID=UPI001E8E055D|nr:Fusaric acid resistance protein-like-domain-containing protein [Boeremia exigua]KAH6643746.1 Fusaric acid resistance protein-like-domain-containing protein [Boeremia exigua]
MTESLQTAAERRFLRPSLRSVTMIQPKTGERVKRSFTLRRSFHRNTESSEFLLAPGQFDPARHAEMGRFERVWEDFKFQLRQAYAYAISPTGIGILKCSLAYILGSLATLVPQIAGLLGKNDGKHMVATITVYFHPARSAGSMIEAVLLAFAAFLYAAFVSFSSMAVSAWFGHQHLLIVGHIIVLIVFIGAGLGLVGWTKHKLGNPLVNVACSLTSLALITVLTKEGAVQNATFSYVKIWQVLKMIIMGCTASAAVALLVRPTSARTGYRDTFIQSTDAMAESLNSIARSFLSGAEQDLRSDSFVRASNKSQSAYKLLVKNLGEAKFEHYVLGTEEEYKISARLVKCLEKLIQSIGGLRSAAETQFTLLAQSSTSAGTPSDSMPVNGTVTSSIFSEHTLSQSPPQLHSPSLSHMERRTSILASIDEVPEPTTGDPSVQPSADVSDDESSNRDYSSRLPSFVQSDLTPADMFSVFIAHLGPPMKSLTYTLREVLSELPFGPGPDYNMTINEHFRHSLVDAKALFSNAKRDALDVVYKTKIPLKTGSAAVAADFEEVAASCGYFSSSLEDFAEDMVTFLDVLEELKSNVNRYPRRRSWTWLKFWQRGRKSKRAHGDDSESSSLIDESTNQTPGGSHEIHNPIYRRSTRGDPYKSEKEQPLSYRTWVALSVFRRDDLKYAVKVGIGAVLYAMWAFFQPTRELYGHWRGEWGLLSYMLVCSMTIGASNTTGFHRFFGTCLGAVYAIIAWIVADESPWVLGFFGWLVSLMCFYIIVGKGKGPMGRFILLTYNLSALYAYSLSVKDEDEDDNDEGGISPEIWEIVLHRVVAVMAGCIWGIIVTRLIWPISARRKLKKGTSLLWLKMGLIWKRGPLKTLLEANLGDTHKPYSYMSEREEFELRRFQRHLESLCVAATFEFELRGPFPVKSFQVIMGATSRILDSMHAMNVIILKDLKASEGEKEVLKYTRKEWTELSWRISHLFSVMASSMKLAYPLNDVLPNVEHTRDRLLAKVFEFRQTGLGKVIAKDEDYELLYAYALVTGQLAHDLGIIGQEIEKLYGVLSEEDLKLQ